MMLKTQDGGGSWTATTLTSGQLLATHFVSATVGWVVGALNHTVLHTADGGGSWRTQQLVGNPLLTVGLVLRGVAFATAVRGWVVGDHGALRVVRVLDLPTLDGPRAVRRFPFVVCRHVNSTLDSKHGFKEEFTTPNHVHGGLILISTTDKQTTAL